METKLSTVKQLVPTEPQPMTKMIAIKPKPVSKSKVGSLQPKQLVPAKPQPKTKMPAIKPKPAPKGKVSSVSRETQQIKYMLAEYSAPQPRARGAKLSVANPKPKLSTKPKPNTKGSRVSKSETESKQSFTKGKPRAVLQSVAKPKASKSTAKGKVAGIKAAPKRIRTIKKIKVCSPHFSNIRFLSFCHFLAVVIIIAVVAVSDVAKNGVPTHH